MASLIVRRVGASLILVVAGALVISGCIVAALVGPDNTANLSSYHLPGTTHTFRADLVSTGGGHAPPGRRSFGTYRLRLVTDETPGVIAVGSSATAKTFLHSA